MGTMVEATDDGITPRHTGTQDAQEDALEVSPISLDFGSEGGTAVSIEEFVTNHEMTANEFLSQGSDQEVTGHWKPMRKHKG